MSKQIRHGVGRGVVLRCLWLAVCLGTVFGPVCALAQGPVVAADGTRLWVLLPKPDRPGVFTLLHHGPGDPASQISKVQTLRGEVRPHGVAAHGDQLWIMYPDGEVQTIRASVTPLGDGWFFTPRVEPSLPRGVSLRAMVVTENGPWALVRIEDRAVLQKIDGMVPDAVRSTDPSRAALRRRNLTLGLPPNYGLDEKPADTQPPDEQNKPGAEQPSAAESAVSLPIDRLLRLERGRWWVTPLPGDWPHGAQAWLTTERDGDKTPTLTALTRGSADNRFDEVEVLEVFRHKDHAQEPAGWVAQRYTTKAQAPTDRHAVIAVEGQLVWARLQHEGHRVSALFWILRGGEALRAGSMSLENLDSPEGVVFGYGLTAALLAQHPREPVDHGHEHDPKVGDPALIWTRADIRGEIVLEPTDLIVQKRDPMQDLASYIGLVVVAVLVTVLMMTFWRRDAQWNQLDLPKGVLVADLSRRVIAAGIDLAPGLLGVMGYYRLSLEELMLRWPGNGLASTLGQMLPGMIVIAVFVTHTTLSELITARTLGKKIAGLRTTALDGSRPRARQLLIRGLLKMFDLIPWAWLLLILPVIGPHRQRLGDLVARTVVVMNGPKEEPKKEDNPDAPDVPDDSEDS